jgi:predicted acyltransferase
MFWIIGGDGIVATLTKHTDNSFVQAVAAQVTDHVDWEGFRYYDMIFPLFLFIIGAVLPFSLGRRLEEGANKKELVKKVLARSAILFLLGLVYNGLLHFDGWDHIRIFGVLQRLAFGYLCASLFVIYTKPKTMAISIVGILLGYWVLMALAPVPGFPHGTYTEYGNFANYIDRLILQPKQMYTAYGDPEGPISNIPSIATALLGVLSGLWLKKEQPEKRKTLGLLLGGLVLVALGLAWSPLFPIIKKIWTSSYVLVAGGCSMMLLGSFHWVVDVKGWSKWALPFTIIGMNSILIYMLSEIVDFGRIAGYFLGGLGKFAPTFEPSISEIGSMLAKLGFLYFLYRQRVFFRV